MSFRITKISMAAAVAAALVPAAAMATNGYFSHGYGIKAKGMGGAGIALPQDSIAAAMNPAGMFYVGNRADVGIDWFKPTRGAEVVGSCFNPPSCTASANGSYDGSATSDFFIPELGYNRMLSPTMSAGISVYGNGGLNTDYTTPFPLFGTTNAGVNLEQAFIAPTVAWQPVPGHVFGASLNLAYQRFKATGLEFFATSPGPSQYPGSVTNQGTDSSYGWGVRVGWMGKVLPACDLGVTYQSKTYMTEFDKYKGLFAEEGAFDIPANYGAGIACRLAPVTLAFDIVQIEYSGIKSINNPLLPNLGQSLLGSSNGAGFGWEDVTAFKFGVQWLVNPDMILRAGYNYGEQPIPQSETLFNVLAPGVVEDHYTIGGTFKIGGNAELSFAYMYAPTVTVNGVNSIPPAFGGGNANIHLKEQSLGFAFGWRY
jgi:long-chain fatty acid transport protein